MGRTWSDEEKAKACAEILKGVASGKSLRAVCRSGDDWIPPESTFREWVDADPELAAHYARAREDREDVIFEECLIIADSQEGDVIEVDGREVTNHDAIQRAKLRIDTRKWMLGKMQPKKYGDRAALELSGPDGGPVQVLDVTKLSDAALAEIVAAGNGEADAG